MGTDQPDSPSAHPTNPLSSLLATLGFSNYYRSNDTEPPLVPVSSSSPTMSRTSCHRYTAEEKGKGQVPTPASDASPSSPALPGAPSSSSNSSDDHLVNLFRTAPEENPAFVEQSPLLPCFLATAHNKNRPGFHFPGFLRFTSWQDFTTLPGDLHANVDYTYRYTFVLLAGFTTREPLEIGQNVHQHYQCPNPCARIHLFGSPCTLEKGFERIVDSLNERKHFVQVNYQQHPLPVSHIDVIIVNFLLGVTDIGICVDDIEIAAAAASLTQLSDIERDLKVVKRFSDDWVSWKNGELKHLACRREILLSEYTKTAAASAMKTREKHLPEARTRLVARLLGSD
ncbi:hypothetical protein IW262DRAFT_1466097 [Armillaria fumosa]|nr:hypothetical protein IW262DRAFT_1466097 [Armillaria fumosa]